MAKKEYKSFDEMVIEEFGEDFLLKDESEEVLSISTGALSIDVSTGIGGIPLGRVTEIFGPESGGKTTLSLGIVKNAMKQGLNCLYVDTENSLDLAYVRDILGENYDESLLTIVQPESAESAFKLTEAGINSGFRVIVFDSIASLSPDEELEKPFDKATMMLSPRLISKFLRRNIFSINKKKIVFIFTNQVRAKIGDFFGGYTTPGGHALRHYISLKIYISKGKAIKDGTAKDAEQIGNFVNFTIQKNKVGKPYRQATTNLYYGKGIDFEVDVISFGSLLGVIKNRGSYFGFEDDTIGSSPGILNTAQYLKENPELLD
ncbi:MAG TPA: DNA recombination/repair protein RecA, partial [Candidatus Dojkabacteria bacterium]